MHIIEAYTSYPPNLVVNDTATTQSPVRSRAKRPAGITMEKRCGKGCVQQSESMIPIYIVPWYQDVGLKLRWMPKYSSDHMIPFANRFTVGGPVFVLYSLLVVTTSFHINH